VSLRLQWLRIADYAFGAPMEQEVLWKPEGMDDPSNFFARRHTIAFPGDRLGVALVTRPEMVRCRCPPSQLDEEPRHDVRATGRICGPAPCNGDR
jgi:hypothetical protein